MANAAVYQSEVDLLITSTSNARVYDSIVEIVLIPAPPLNLPVMQQGGGTDCNPATAKLAHVEPAKYVVPMQGSRPMSRRMVQSLFRHGR